MSAYAETVRRYFSASVVYSRLFSAASAVHYVSDNGAIPSSVDSLGPSSRFLVDDTVARCIMRYPSLNVGKRMNCTAEVKAAIHELLVIGYIHPEHGSDLSNRMVALGRALALIVEHYAGLLIALNVDPTYVPTETPEQYARHELRLVVAETESREVLDFESAYDKQVKAGKVFVDSKVGVLVRPPQPSQEDAEAGVTAPTTPPLPRHISVAAAHLERSMLHYCMHVAAPMAAAHPDEYDTVKMLAARYADRIGMLEHDVRVFRNAGNIDAEIVMTMLVGAETNDGQSAFKAFFANAAPFADYTGPMDKLTLLDAHISAKNSNEVVLIWRVCLNLVSRVAEFEYRDATGNVAVEFAKVAARTLTTTASVIPSGSSILSATAPAPTSFDYAAIVALFLSFIRTVILEEYERTTMDAVVRLINMVYIAADLSYEFEPVGEVTKLILLVLTGTSNDLRFTPQTMRAIDWVARNAEAEVERLPVASAYSLLETEAIRKATVKNLATVTVEKAASEGLMQAHDLVSMVILDLVYSQFSSFYSSDVMALLTYLQRRTPTAQLAKRDPLSHANAGTQQIDFFRPHPEEPLMLSAALNTFAAVDAQVASGKLTLQESVWADRIAALEKEAAKEAVAPLAAKPAPSSGWTTAEKLERIRGQWTPAELARAALRQAIDAQSTRRPALVSMLPRDTVYRILWALFSSADFVGWLQRYNVVQQNATLPETEAGSESTANESAFVNVQSVGVDERYTQTGSEAHIHCGLVDEPFARALIGALIEQQRTANYDFKPFIALALSYGYSATHLHEFWRQAIYGPIDDPATVVCSDATTPSGMSALDTRAAMAQFSALLDLDALLDSAIKNAATEAGGISRVALLRAVLFYTLTYLRPNTGRLMFTQQLAPDGHVLFDHFSSLVPVYIMAQIYNWPPWPVSDNRGIEAEALSYCQPIQSLRAKEIMQLVLGVHGGTRIFADLAAAENPIARPLPLEFATMDARNSLKAIVMGLGDRPEIQNQLWKMLYAWLAVSAASDRMLARHPPGVLPYNDGDTAAGRAMVFARIPGKDDVRDPTKWVDISPLAGIDTSLNSRDGAYLQSTTAFVADSRYGYYDWRRALFYYINPAVARLNSIDMARRYDNLGAALNAAGLTARLNTDLGPPTIMLHQNSPLFYVLNIALLDFPMSVPTAKIIADAARTMQAALAAPATPQASIYEPSPQPLKLLRSVLPRRIEGAPIREAARLSAMLRRIQPRYDVLEIRLKRLWERALRTLKLGGFSATLEKHKPKLLDRFAAELQRLRTVTNQLRGDVGTLTYTDVEATALEAAHAQADADIKAYDYYVHMLEGAGAKFMAELDTVSAGATEDLETLPPLDI